MNELLVSNEGYEVRQQRQQPVAAEQNERDGTSSFTIKIET